MALVKHFCIPLRFEPIYQYRLWGRPALGDLPTAPLPSGPVGEAWILSDSGEGFSLLGVAVGLWCLRPAVLVARNALVSTNGVVSGWLEAGDAPGSILNSLQVSLQVPTHLRALLPTLGPRA